MIYFLQPLNGGPVKIGTTINLDARRSQLESHYGQRLALLATMPGGRKEEKIIHARFAHLRFGRTEQFQPAADLMAFIGRPLLVDANPDAVEAMAPASSVATSQARLELPSHDMERVRRAGKSIGLSLSEFIRQAVLEKAVEVERRMGIRE